MTDYSQVSIPKPKDWQDFERKCRILFECVLNDPGVHFNGTSGQKQQGVDIYGRHNGRGLYWVGVQCKKKYESRVTKPELRKEAMNARDFRPELSRFILVTTASGDVDIDEEARLLTDEHEKAGVSFTVEVWGWERLESEISKYPKAVEAFHPDAFPFSSQFSEKLDRTYDVTEQTYLLMQQMAEQFCLKPVTVDTSASLEKLDTHLHTEIDIYRDFITEGKPRTAMELLEKLKKQVWDGASDRIKFRLITNIGSARLRMGNETEAADDFLQAAPYQPEDRVGLANTALAYLLKGEAERASDAARKALEADETNAEAASYLIQTCLYDMAIEAPEILVPKPVRNSEAVVLACIHFYRMRDNRKWIDVAGEAETRYPSNEQISRVAAEAKMETVFSSQGYRLGQKPDQAVNQGLLQEAATKLQQLWDWQCSSEIPDVDPSLPANLAQSYMALGDDDAAVTVLRKAIDLMPTSRNLIKLWAGVCLDKNHPQEALTWLRKNDDPESRLMVAEILAQTSPAEVIDVLDNIEAAEGIDAHHRIFAARFRIHAFLGHPNLQPEDRDRAARSEYDKLNAQFPDSPLTALCLAEIMQAADESQIAISKALQRAKAALNAQTPFYIRYMLAKQMEHHEKYNEVVDLLKDHVDTWRDNPALRTLLIALIHGDHRAQANKLIEALPVEVSATPFFLNAALRLHLRRGKFDAAEQAANKLLEHCPKDAEIHLTRLELWHRYRNSRAIEEFMESDVEHLDGTVDNMMRIAHMLDRYGYHDRALKLGYRLHLSNPKIPEIQMGYMGLLMLSRSSKGLDLNRDRVGADTAFGVRSARGETQTFVIEFDPNLHLREEMIEPIHPIAQRADGLAAGDTFQLRDQEWEVTSVKHKYLHSLHAMMERFEMYFPEFGGFQRIIFKGDDSSDMSQLLEQVKARSISGQKVLEVYSRQPLPLEFFADFLGVDVIDAWYGLQQEQVIFKVCVGSAAERMAAIQDIHANDKNGCVVDALTLHIIRLLGLEGVVTDVCGSMAATETTIDTFRIRLEKLMQHGRDPYMVLSWRDDQHFREEITRERLASVTEALERELEWISENINIIPAETMLPIPEEAARIRDEMSPYFLDPIIAAQGSNRLLLCEDLSYRQFGIQEFGVPATWLQPILMTGRELGVLSLDAYCNAVLALAEAGHRFTAVDRNLLMQMLKIKPHGFNGIAKTLFGPHADFQSHAGVMISFLRQAWAKSAPSLNLRKASSVLLYRLCFGEWLKDVPDADPYELLEFVQKEVSNQDFRNYVNNWGIGHIVTRIGYR